MLFLQNEAKVFVNHMMDQIRPRGLVRLIRGKSRAGLRQMGRDFPRDVLVLLKDAMGYERLRGMHISTLTGADLQRALPQLAALRIEVFRDFPYLYDGSADYEESYLTALIKSKDSIIVAAEDDGKIIGCATGSALEGHHQEFAAPFREHGFDPGEIFYCASTWLRVLSIKKADIGFRSTEMAFRPALIVSIAVTPEPPNGSRTISPGIE